MERDFSSLSNAVFDMLVIGGGATGAAIAWDACLRGLHVALIDKAAHSPDLHITALSRCERDLVLSHTDLVVRPREVMQHNN